LTQQLIQRDVKIFVSQLILYISQSFPEIGQNPMRKSRRVLILLFLLFLVINTAASANTYYVATNGKDSNPGTKTLPWLTWNMGLTSANPGDTVYFRGGVYPGTTLNGEGIWAEGGTATQGIYYYAYPGETPILDGSNISNPSLGVNFAIRVWGVQNVHFKGLTIRNFHERFSDVITQAITAEDIGNSTF